MASAARVGDLITGPSTTRKASADGCSPRCSSWLPRTSGGFCHATGLIGVGRAAVAGLDRRAPTPRTSDRELHGSPDDLAGLSCLKYLVALGRGAVLPRLAGSALPGAPRGRRKPAICVLLAADRGRRSPSSSTILVSTTHHLTPWRLTAGPDIRGVGLAVGCLAALCVPELHRLPPSVRPARRGRFSSVLALAGDRRRSGSVAEQRFDFGTACGGLTIFCIAAAILACTSAMSRDLSHGSRPCLARPACLARPDLLLALPLPPADPHRARSAVSRLDLAEDPRDRAERPRRCAFVPVHRAARAAESEASAAVSFPRADPEVRAPALAEG